MEAPKLPMMPLPENRRYDTALGALLGACVGDAAGATLEFLGRQPTHEEVQLAMSMPGGGVFNLAPGQITDDGELTLCLGQALSGSKSFSIERIARRYSEWVESRPFDIGQTTLNSLGCPREAEWKETCEREGYATAMARAAQFRCGDSKANGSLMRASPLGIWGWDLNVNDLALLAREDSRLSHPNRSCCDAVACYVIALSQLLRNSDRVAAFEAAKMWAEANAVTEVCDWLSLAASNEAVPFYPLAGFVKIAFTHAFRHLLLESDFVFAMRETLSGGGDTDTNACIVGGMIGAACGAASIPDYMKIPVLTCDTKSGPHPRPDFLQTTQIPVLVEALLVNAPGG